MISAGTGQRTGFKVVVHAGPTLFRETLTQALAARGHVVQATTVDDMLFATDAVLRLDPDVCIVDGVEPSVWFEGARRLRGRAPALRIVVLGGAPTANLVRAYDTGVVDAVVERGCVFDQLHSVLVRTVRGDRCVVEPHSLPSLEADPVLTIRERQVLTGLVRGASTYTIAQELRISPHTVRMHVSGLMRKLGVHARGKAVSVAVARDLLEARSA